MDQAAVDAHAHCGVQDRSVPQSFEDYYQLARETPITEVVMFPPVYEIYDRFDPSFQDTPGWKARRRAANDYVLSLSRAAALTVHPYFFIWNDFEVEDLDPGFKGIKWHRHASEPEYNYQDPACRKALQLIRQRNLPVVLEEEFENTVRFIEELAPEVRVVIPHLGGLNGGYARLAERGLFARETVYTDTSLAGRGEIVDYLERFGSQRIMFGSDFPFGHPGHELSKVRSLPVEQTVQTALTGGNLQRLLADVCLEP